MLNNKNMSSPFQQKFSGKSPFRKEGVVTLSEKDIKDAKSASSEPSKEISFEGQGGIDYESKDYKKKTEVSPLNNYYNPQGEIYLSDMPAFQQLQSDITGLADAVANESSANKAKRLQGRVDTRNRRGARKNEILRGDAFEGNEAGVTGAQGKTYELQQKANKYRESANQEAKAKNQQKLSDYIDQNPRPSDNAIEAKKASLGIE